MAMVLVMLAIRAPSSHAHAVANVTAHRHQMVACLTHATH